MSKTGDDRLDAILNEWAYDIENTPPNRPLRLWVGHFHQHHVWDEPLSNPGFEDEPHECIGVVITGSNIRDVPASLSAYIMSQEVTCTALAFQTTEREFIVTHTDSPSQWRVTWSLDDYGSVDFKRIRPAFHLGSRRLMRSLRRSTPRGELSLEDAMEVVKLLTRKRENDD